MNFLAGVEVMLFTFLVLISLKNIGFFRVILESFQLVFRNLLALIIIMTLLLLTFAVMIWILLGNKYTIFSNPFQIQRLAGILISFKDIVTFTDNFDKFTTLVFMVPYFLIIKYTVLFLIIAIIYSSISTAQKNIKQKSNMEIRSIELGEFVRRTFQILFESGKNSRHGSNNTCKYVASINFSQNQDVRLSELTILGVQQAS